MYQRKKNITVILAIIFTKLDPTICKKICLFYIVNFSNVIRYVNRRLQTVLSETTYYIEHYVNPDYTFIFSDIQLILNITTEYILGRNSTSFVKFLYKKYPRM
jgi:hypothetical protein